jgi:micrococcal nuclease
MNKCLIIILLASLSTLNISCESRSQKNSKSVKLEIGKPNSGKVVGIIDGDTYDILMDGNKTIRIRMEGIDAPEKGMPFYKAAKKYLSTLCFGKQVTLKISGKDNRDRTLAFSYLENGTELSHEMLKAGLAWHFKKYNSDSVLAQLEIEAQNAKIGIWSMENPMSPWDNRSLHRNGISTKDSFKIESHNE